MVTRERNLEIWDSVDHWEHGVFGDGIGLEDGEKWSRAWGSSERQWNVTIKPRIKKFLRGKILEIAPGRGRWTAFLYPYADELTIVDISANCIDYCRKRFSEFSNIDYIVNDGRSLPGVAPGSIDFIFSFDSLVHVDLEDISVYISEIARTLSPEGHAFLHHSNLGEYPNGIQTTNHMRSPEVSGNEVTAIARDAGLTVVSQESIPWSQDNLDERVFIDCLTVLSKAQVQHGPSVMRNTDFLEEQRRARELQL